MWNQEKLPLPSIKKENGGGPPDNPTPPPPYHFHHHHEMYQPPPPQPLIIPIHSATVTPLQMNSEPRHIHGPRVSLRLEYGVGMGGIITQMPPAYGVEPFYFHRFNRISNPCLLNNVLVFSAERIGPRRGGPGWCGPTEFHDSVTLLFDGILEAVNTRHALQPFVSIIDPSLVVVPS